MKITIEVEKVGKGYAIGTLDPPSLVGVAMTKKQAANTVRDYIITVLEREA